jgi:hypothetical protein
MIPEQLYRWKIALELKLRKCSGTAFQDFFADVMAAKHGSDYVRIRPYGSLGDKGCDGCLQPTGDVFACYGAVNGDGGKVDYLIGKMGDDYGKSVASLSTIMTGWHMVHNLVDGLPTDAVLKLNELKSADKTAFNSASRDWKHSKRSSFRCRNIRSKPCSAWPRRHTIPKISRSQNSATSSGR